MDGSMREPSVGDAVDDPGFFDFPESAGFFDVVDVVVVAVVALGDAVEVAAVDPVDGLGLGVVELESGVELVVGYELGVDLVVGSGFFIAGLVLSAAEVVVGESEVDVGVAVVLAVLSAVGDSRFALGIPTNSTTRDLPLSCNPFLRILRRGELRSAIDPATLINTSNVKILISMLLASNQVDIVRDKNSV